MSEFFDVGASGLDQVIERLGWTLVHSLWQFTLVAMFAAVALLAMRRRSAEARSAVLVGLMMVSVGLPIGTWVWQSSRPVVSVTGKGVSPEPGVFAEPTETAGNESPFPPGTVQPSISQIPRNIPDPVGAMVVLQDAPTSAGSVTVVPVAVPRSTWTERTTTLLRPWLSWAVAAWGLGVVLCSLRPLIGWLTLRRLRRVGVSPAGAEIIAALGRVSEQLSLNRRVKILQSSLAQVPLVVGYLRPVILLPVSLVSNIPATQLEAILAHELAHIRRHDFVVNLLQIVVETLFFYHPAVWWLSHRIRVEREHCCDDLVVRTMNNRTEYGRALIAIEELRGRHTALALGASDGSLVARIRRIAGLPRERSGVSVASGMSILALLLGMAVLFGTTTNRGLASANGNDPADDDEVVAETPLPEGSTLRFGTARFRTGEDIESMAVSTDDLRAVAGRESGARGFDLVTGRSTYSLQSGLLGLAISPDGKSIVAKGEQTVGIYDAETGKRLRTIKPPDDSWNWTDVVEFTPNGNAFAVASDSKMKEGIPAAVHLVNFKLGKTMRVFPLDNPETDSPTRSRVVGVAFSPDGKFMASGGYDNDQGVHFARLWNVQSGAEIRRFVHGNGGFGIRSLTFSPDGRTLATRPYNGRLRIFDVATGEPIKTFEKDRGGRKKRTVAFSPDGKTLAVAGDSLRLFNTATNEERLRIDRAQVSNLHFTDGGKYLVGAYMGAIYRWNTATGEPQTPVAGDSAVSQVFVTPDERRVITHGFLGDAHVWDATSGKHLHRFGASWQRKIAMSPDGRFLAWAVRDETIRVRRQPFVFYGTRIRLYDVANNKIIDRFPGSKSDAGSLAFTADGKKLITIGHRDGVVHVWNFETGKEERSFVAVPDAEKNEPNQVARAVLSPDGKTLVVEHPPYDESIVLEDGTRVDRMGGKLQRPRPVRLWDIATGKLRVMWGPVSEVNVRGDVAFSPDSRLLVSSNGRVLENAAGRQALKLPHDRSLDAMAFSSDGRFLAIAVRDVIQIWDVATWKKREEFKSDNDVTSLTFTPSGKLLSGHDDTTVLAWEPPSTSVVSNHEQMQPVRSVELTGIYLGKSDDFGVLLRFIGRASKVPGKKAIREGRWEVSVPMASIGSTFELTDNETTGAIDLHVGFGAGKWDQPVGKVERGVSGTLYLTTYRATIQKHYRFLDRIPLRKVSDHKFIEKEDRQLLATTKNSADIPPNQTDRSPAAATTPKDQRSQKGNPQIPLDKVHWREKVAGLQVGMLLDAPVPPNRVVPLGSAIKYPILVRNTTDEKLSFATRLFPHAFRDAPYLIPADKIAKSLDAAELPGEFRALNGREGYRMSVAYAMTLEPGESAIIPRLGSADFGLYVGDGDRRNRPSVTKVQAGMNWIVQPLEIWTTSDGLSMMGESNGWTKVDRDGNTTWLVANREVPLAKGKILYPRVQVKIGTINAAGDPNLKRELSALIDKGLAPFLTLEAAAAKAAKHPEPFGGVPENVKTSQLDEKPKKRKKEGNTAVTSEPKPDENGVYWSSDNKEGWVAGMKIISRPTRETPTLVVRHLLRNETDKGRSIDLSIHGRSKSRFYLWTGNRIGVDFGGGSWEQKTTVAARQILQRAEWESTINLAGLDPGTYSTRLGAVFFVPIEGQIGSRSGIPFGLHLPIVVPAPPSGKAVTATSQPSTSAGSRFRNQTIRWGKPVSGLRLGVVFLDVPEDSNKVLRHGDLGQTQLLVQNVSAENIECQFDTPHWNDGWGLNIEDASGTGVKNNRMGMSGWSGTRRFAAVLSPKQIQPMTGRLTAFREVDGGADAELKHVEFRVAATAPTEHSHSPPATYGMPAGQYSARCFALLRRADIPDAYISVDTDSLPFRVSAADEGDAVVRPGKNNPAAGEAL